MSSPKSSIAFEHDFTVSLVSKDSSLFSECSFLKISLPFRFHGCESLSSLRMLTAHLCDTSFCSYHCLLSCLTISLL